MFIPLGDDNSLRRSSPIVVYILLVVNSVVWLLQESLGDVFTYGFSTVPYEITHRVDLASAVSISMGGGAITIPHFPGPSLIYLTILSAMFMHGSWMHIIGNMVYLAIFGDQIEDYLGKFRFIVFYLLCGIAASVAHIAYDPDSMIPSLGASGAIAGVLGAYLVRYPHNRVRVLFARQVVLVPASIVLGLWFVLQFLGQFGTVGGEGGIAYMAHIGGFIAGVVLVFLMGRRVRA